MAALLDSASLAPRSVHRNCKCLCDLPEDLVELQILVQ